MSHHTPPPPPSRAPVEVTPETLHAIMVDTTDAELDKWRHMLPLYLDSIARENAPVYEAVGCGATFHDAMTMSLRDPTTARYAVVMCVLLYCHASPVARTRMHEKDRHFLMVDFARDLKFWLDGLDCNGQTFSRELRPERLLDSTVVGFVTTQQRRYRYAYAHARK